MTALDSRTDSPPFTGGRDAVAPKQSIDRRAVFGRVVTIALIALLALLASYAGFRIFEGPIADAWYSTRQHQLASQLAASRVHAGRGNAVAVMQIPRVGMNLVIAEGDSPQQLRSGPGHRIGTPMPGAIGNSVITGHASGWGGPFAALKDLKSGDLVVVQAPGPVPVYGFFKVSSTREVSAHDVAPFANSTDRRVTFVSGAGSGFSDRRLVVTAVSGPVGELLAPQPDLRASTSAGSLAWNAEVALAFCGFAIAFGLIFALRKRYSTMTLALMVTPVVALGLLGLLLDLDAALPPLR